VMNDLSRFWRSLERVHGLHAIRAFWALYCGPHFDLIRPHLRATDLIGGNYPCPYPSPGHCPRRIIDLGDGQFEAICCDPYKVCPDVPLRQAQSAPSDRFLHKPIPRDGTLAKLLPSPVPQGRCIRNQPWTRRKPLPMTSPLAMSPATPSVLSAAIGRTWAILTLWP